MISSCVHELHLEPRNVHPAVFYVVADEEEELAVLVSVPLSARSCYLVAEACVIQQKVGVVTQVLSRYAESVVPEVEALLTCCLFLCELNR